MVFHERTKKYEGTHLICLLRASFLHAAKGKGRGCISYRLGVEGGEGARPKYRVHYSLHRATTEEGATMMTFMVLGILGGRCCGYRCTAECSVVSQPRSRYPGAPPALGVGIILVRAFVGTHVLTEHCGG